MAKRLQAWTKFWATSWVWLWVVVCLLGADCADAQDGAAGDGDVWVRVGEVDVMAMPVHGFTVRSETSPIAGERRVVVTGQDRRWDVRLTVFPAWEGRLVPVFDAGWDRLWGLAFEAVAERFGEASAERARRVVSHDLGELTCFAADRRMVEQWPRGDPREDLDLGSAQFFAAVLAWEARVMVAEVDQVVVGERADGTGVIVLLRSTNMPGEPGYEAGKQVWVGHVVYYDVSGQAVSRGCLELAVWQEAGRGVVASAVRRLLIGRGR